MDAALLVVVVTVELEKITLIQATTTEEQDWQAQTLNMLTQTEPETLEENPENIQIGNETLIVFVEGRKPRCLKCDKLGHARVEWKPPREETEEEGEEKENEILKERENSNQEKQERWSNVKGKMHLGSPSKTPF